jgi:hypothetical protein
VPCSHEESSTTLQEPAIRGNGRDTFLIRQLRQRHDLAAQTHSVSIRDVMPVIGSATADLRRACRDGLDVTKATMEFVNKRRYKRDSPSVIQQHTENLEKTIAEIRLARDAFSSSGQRALLAPYETLIQGIHSDEERRQLPMQALLLAYSYASTIIVSADAILEFMELVQEKQRKRLHARLWMPYKLSHSLRKLLTSKQAEAAIGDGLPMDDSSSADFSDNERIYSMSFLFFL